MTQPDKDGWIEWHGGECPVHPDTVVEVRFRNGVLQRQHRPIIYTWDMVGDMYDICAYRIITPAPSYEGDGECGVLSVREDSADKASGFKSRSPSPYATIMRGFAAQHSCALSCVLVNEMKGEIL